MLLDVENTWSLGIARNGVRMKTPVNKQTLKQHFTYSWWKYLLIAALAFGLVDLLYTVTAYRVPSEKKVEFYVYGQINESGLQAYLDQVRETELPEMEEVSCLQIIPDSAYGPMQLMTYLAAGEGDVYLLPHDEFVSYAMEGALVPLENDEELMALFNEAGINLQNGWRQQTETGENHLCGIPQGKLPGLINQYAYADDGYLCVSAVNGNDANVMRFLRILCRDCISEK